MTWQAWFEENTSPRGWREGFELTTIGEIMVLAAEKVGIDAGIKFMRRNKTSPSFLTLNSLHMRQNESAFSFQRQQFNERIPRLQL
jgi:hypothetical protein